MDQTLKTGNLDTARSAATSTSKAGSTSSKGKQERHRDHRDKAPLETAALESTPLWRALQEEDWESVKLDARRPDSRIHSQDECFGWCAGHFAANAGAGHALVALLDAKMKLDAVDNEGNSMLMTACRNGHTQAAELLVGRKADPDAQNKNGWTALMWASMNGHEELAAWMLDTGVNIAKADNGGMTACMWAARHGHYGIIEVFLACGLNLRTCDQSGLTVLDHCNEHMQMAATVAAIAELDECLHIAALHGDEDAARDAIEAGADVDLRDGDGWTPLMWAALNNSLDMVELIVRYGARPSLLDENGHVIEALQTQHLDVGAEVERILGANERLLAAAQDNDWEQAQAELAIGAFINVRDENHRTSLMWAAKHCNAEGVHMLLDRSASVNDRDSFGWAAVHFATIERSPETVSMFHFLGADMAVRTYEGDGLLHMAVRADDAVMIQLLLAAGLDTEDADINLFTPLMLSASCGLVNAMQALIAYGASVNAKSTEALGSRSALALAVASGHEAAVSSMLQAVQVPPKLPTEDCDGRAAKPRAATSAPVADVPTAPDASPQHAAAKASSGASAKKGAAAAKQASAKAKTAASGVAARKKAAPKSKVDFKSESPSALLDEAIRRRAEAPWKSVTAPGRTVVKQTDGLGATALALAVTCRKTSIGMLLLQAKSDANAVDDAGNTVLMQAVATRQREVVETMLGAGARMEKKNKNGLTALDMCEDEVIRLMLERRDAQSQVPPADAILAKAMGEKSAKRAAKKEEIATQHRVRVENLPVDEPPEDVERYVRHLMRVAGAPLPKRVNVVKDPITGQPRGFAYAEFADAAAVDLASRADGGDVQGREVRVIKEPRKPAPEEEN